MQVIELKNEGLSYELEVTVTAQDIDGHIDARLREVGKTARLPGFRPGHVPMNILKQRYGRAVLGEVLEQAVNDSTAKALQEKGLRPALQPKIEVKEFDEGKDLKYTMAVEVMPEFKVMDLKGIAVEKPVAKPDAKAVDEALERIASHSRETESVTSGRAAKKDDIVVIDFKGRTKDGTEYPGMAGSGHHLTLGSGQFIPGFEEQLIGKKAGDKAEVEVTFPEGYHKAELSGQPAIFEVEITELREPKKTVIDDEFAKKMGLDDLGALRGLVEKQIQNEYDQYSRMKLKRALLDALDEGHDFPVPGGMLDMEFGSILQQIKTERSAQAQAGEPELEDGEQDELRAIAERRVRLGMILSEIGQANNIKVTDQELQRAVIAEAQRYPGQEAEVFEFFRKNRQALESLRAPVFEDKVIDFIVELAKVTEKDVPLEALTAEDEEPYAAKKDGAKKSASASKPKAAAKKADKADKADDGEEKAPAKKKAAAKK